MTEKRLDRVSRAVEQPLDPSSLVGSFFHSDHQRGWQGCVVAEPLPGVYLVETYEWFAGSPHDQRLVGLEEMMDWSFYDDAQWMNNAYENGVQHRWDQQRKQESADEAQTDWGES